MTDPFAKTVFKGDDTLASEGVSAPASDAPSADRDTEGRRVAGRYEIVGLVGAGGMGNVYRARDLELGEVVALKMLRPEITASPGALDRFRSEVKLARRVTHPNVARVFDIGEDGGDRYLTMELIDGEPLSSILRREGKLPLSRAVEIASQVCDGLTAAHAASVVHRDLKPDNVLIAKGGRAVVTDFGIARAAGAAEGPSPRAEAFVGTPAYMSPEQVEGKTAGPAADLYALGAMLFEMITGEPPWSGDSVFAVAAARLLAPPPDSTSKRPEAPRELHFMIRTLLARAPEDRYPHASIVRDLLRSMPVAPGASDPPPALSPGIEAPIAWPDSGARRVRPQTEVAVLPLRNAGPPDDDYVADGLTEDLIDQLSSASGIRVRARGTVAKLRNADRDPREIGRDLGVAVVVDGTVRRTPQGVRVSVRLVSVADGVQIWHKRFDRGPEDLLSLSDDAARAVAEALFVEIAQAEHPAAHPEAVDLYLRARALYMRFFSDTTGASIALFERARALAPDDPRILAGYAMAAARKWSRDPSAAALAKEAARAAIARAPHLPESHVAHATMHYQERREPEAVSALKQALTLSPANAEAHDMLGRILAETTLLDEAVFHLESALAAEPGTHLARQMIARVHMLRGQWDEARRLVLGSEESGFLPAVARYCLWARDVDLARSTLAKLEAAGFDWHITKVVLGAVANNQVPWEVLPKPGTVTNRFYGFVCQITTEAAMYIGDRERALDALERANASQFFDLAWMDGCPLLADLRADPRFQAARRDVAARATAIEQRYRPARLARSA